MSGRTPDRLLAAAVFAVACAVYASTAGPCLGFDDAAELAECARDWTTAHPPGFPAYVALGHLWLVLFGGIGGLVPVLQWFSIVLAAGGVALVALAASHVLAARAPATALAARRAAAAIAALAYGTGVTVWQWANAVEVYALQSFAAALLLYAVSHQAPRRASFALAGLAIGLGLADHHATMVLLLPVAAALAAAVRANALRDRRWLWTLAVAALVAATFYGLMMWRAGGDHGVAFGRPDTPSRLLYHMKGGAYGEGMFRPYADFGGRAVYLATVVLRNLQWFLLPLLLGAFRLARTPFVWLALAQLGALVVLQAGRTAVANADCYLLPALTALPPLVALGLAGLFARRFRLAAGLAVLAVAAVFAVDLAPCDRSAYDAGAAWNTDFERSAPDRAIVVLQRWDHRVLAHHYRAEGRRPDLVLLASDVKGTDCDNVKRAFPAFAQSLEPEYGAYLAAIAAVDPDLVHTDHYRLDGKALVDTYTALLHKVRAVAAAEHRPLLFDRAAVAFLLENKLLRADEVFPSGILFSLGKLPDAPAPTLSGSWWTSPFVLQDLCAAAVLRDYEQVLAQDAKFYAFTGDPKRAGTEALLARLRERTSAYAADKPFLGWKDPSRR